MDDGISATNFTNIDAQNQCEDSDEILARAVSSGDVEAWDRFFDRFLSWAYRFVFYHLGGNRADTEDLCSDILMTAARSIKKYDATRGTLDIWMLGIARHRLARFRRRHKIELVLTPEVIDDAEQDVSSIEERVITQHEVDRVLSEMPERQVTALIGKYLEGYSVEELARIMSATPKAVEMLLRRGRSAFKSAFAADMEVDGDE